MCNICAIYVQYLCNICAISVQYICNICAIYVQYMCNIRAIYVQYMCNISAISVQYMYNICAIYVQYLCNSWTANNHHINAERIHETCDLSIERQLNLTTSYCTLIIGVTKMRRFKGQGEVTLQAMYIWRNTVARSHNYCCSGNTAMHSVCYWDARHCKVYEILSVVKQCFHDKFLLWSTIRECLSSCRVSISARLLTTLFRHTIWLNRAYWQRSRWAVSQSL
jgi:hypothetical protein